MAQEPSIKILFIEDLPADAELAIRELRQGGLVFDSVRVDTREGFLEALETFRPDVVVSDFSMPNFDGMAALLLVRERQPLLPFIVLTGSMNEETAVDCMKAGASDYVIKEHRARLPFALRDALRRNELHKKNAEQEELLRQSEDRYRSIFTDTHAVMLIVDPANCLIVDANQAAVEYYGWPREKLVGKTLTEVNTLGQEMLREQLRRASSGEKRHFQFKHKLADGSVRDVETHSSPVTIGGKLFLLSIVHDISDRLAAQRERDTVSRRLAHYLATSPTITYALALEGGASHMHWISDNVQFLLGYTVEEATRQDWWFENLFQEDRSEALSAVSLALELKSITHEYRFLRKDRTLVWIRDEKRLVEDEKGNGEIVGTLTDVTEQKRAETENRLKSAALEAVDTAMLITNRDGTIEWVNSAFEALTGYSRHEATGKKPGDLVKSGRQDSAFYRELWDTILAGRPWHGELVNRKKSGDLYIDEMKITPVLNSFLNIEHFIASATDVTERTRSRERLLASLAEKEVLLKEIHHRVNNNLQIVISLLRLSSDTIRDASLRFLIGEISRRVSAMSLVHELFYSAQDVARIDFAAYLYDLVSDLIEKFQLKPGEVEILQRSEEVLLNLETAIPAALIVSELVSNSLKAILARGRKETPWGRLSILLMKTVSESVTIEVRDDGPGLPEGVDPATAESLGLALIRILSEQLHGSTEFTKGPGTAATLRFPLPASRTEKESKNGRT